MSKNLRGEAEAFPNGSLYLITGCDKTYSVSCVAIPLGSDTAGDLVELQYNQSNKEQPWSHNRRARICRFNEETNPGASYGVFLRGIKIALSSRSWSLNMEYIEPDMRPYYNILSKPVTGRLERIIRSLELRFGLGLTSIYNRPEVVQFTLIIISRSRRLILPQVPFHVSDIIAQLVLKDVIKISLSHLLHTHPFAQQSPDAKIAIVEDHVWTNHVDPVGLSPLSLTLLMSYLLGFG